MELQKEFEEFLQNIRLTESQKQDLIKGHSTLRERLDSYTDFPDNIKILKTFLQGSYKRGTAVKPNGDKRADVDVVVVTNINQEFYTPEQALKIFEPFLEKHYKGKYKLNNRSYGIELSYVDLDLVVTTEPSQNNIKTFNEGSFFADDFTLESSKTIEFTNSITSLYNSAPDPLLIPDREMKKWVETNPVAQILWTQTKNANCNSHYINVVKSLKWWQINNCQEGLLNKYPKGYPLEHIIGECCPDGIDGMAQGINSTFKNIIDKFAINILSRTVPVLNDHGVSSHNVLKRITFDDFEIFYNKVKADFESLSNVAYFSDDKEESAKYWQELLGDEFPVNGNYSSFDEDKSGPFKNISIQGNTRPEEYA